MEFTEEAVKALRPTGSDKIDGFVWDASMPGFGIRTRGKACKWIIQYRFGTTQRRESLGHIGKLTLKQARDIARKRFAQIELGTDPVGERKAKAQAEAAKAAAQTEAEATTLAKVVERYFRAREADLRPSTLTMMRRHLERYWSPLADMPIAEIRQPDVAKVLRKLIDTHKGTSAARARSSLISLFTWAMKEGLLPDAKVNPAAMTHDPDPRTERDRVLNDAELRAVWNACPDYHPFNRIIRLLILTGARRQELGDLSWNEIDGNVVTIPGTRTKNHKTFLITLPDLAMDIVRGTPVIGDHLFSENGFSGWSWYKSDLDKRIAEMQGKPLKPWRLHDIRHSFATGLHALETPKIPEIVVERCLNHIKGGIAKRYNHHAYRDEKADALRRWADHVSSVVKG
jgi:integrase